LSSLLSSESIIIAQTIKRESKSGYERKGWRKLSRLNRQEMLVASPAKLLSVIARKPENGKPGTHLLKKTRARKRQKLRLLGLCDHVVVVESVITLDVLGLRTRRNAWGRSLAQLKPIPQVV
jgi:hypothetical protein